MNNLMKRTVAAIMALTIVGGATSGVFDGMPLFEPTITVQAESIADYNETTQTLVFHGNVTTALAHSYRDIAYVGDHWEEIPNKPHVKHVSFADNAVLPSDCSDMFLGYGSLESIDLSAADASNVTDVSKMFCTHSLEGTSKLSTIKFGNLDTANWTSMASMFEGCDGLTTLDLQNLNTSNVTDMSKMFGECTNLRSLDLSRFDTSKVTNMRSMFSTCENLSSLTLSNFANSKVTDMSHMFYYCSNLNSLDLSSFYTPKVTDMSNMFERCYSLTSLDLSSFDTSNVTNMNGMFEASNSLISLKLSSFNTSNVTDMSYMFSACRKLKQICVSNKWDTSKCTSSGYMFSACDSIEGKNGTYYNSNNTGLEYARVDKVGNPGYLTDTYSDLSTAPSRVSFDDTTGTLTIGGNIALSDIQAYKNTPGLKHIVALSGTILPADCSDMFFVSDSVDNWGELESIDFSKADSSNVSNMRAMFCGCKVLTSIDLSGFNTSKVTNMYSMFSNNPQLTKLDLSSFDTSNVTSMMCAFSDCSKLSQIIVSDKWDISNVKESTGMFKNCSSIVGKNGTVYDTNHTNYDYAYIDTPERRGYFTDVKSQFNSVILLSNGTLKIFGNVDPTEVKLFANDYSINGISAANGTILPEDCTGLFAGFKVTSINLTNADTSNVTNMQDMFLGCTNITSLDLSSFDTSNVTNMKSMFASCTSLKKIYASDKWDTSKIVDNDTTDMASDMFFNCTNLKGRKGTKLTDGYTDSEYARIDTITNPGYFSLQSSSSLVEGASLTLDGNLDVNFYVDLTSDVTKVVLSGPTGDVEYTSDELEDKKQTNGLYKFSYSVNATRADAPISLKLYNEHNMRTNVYNSNFVKTADKTAKCSVNDYLAAAKANENLASYDKEKFNALVSATKNYVDAADNYFNNATNTITGVSGIDVFDDTYNPYAGGHFSNKYKMALVLNSETAVRIFYNGDETTATIRGGSNLETVIETLDKKHNANGDYFELANIPAHELTELLVLQIGTETIMISPISYGYLVKTKSSDETLKTLCCAFYDYAKAAEAYHN